MEPLSAESIAKPATKDAAEIVAWREAFGDPTDPAVQAAVAETVAVLNADGASELGFQAVRRDKINAVVSHLWRASEPFQRTGTCLTETEWRISIERLYEAIATGHPEFGGWPAPEWAALEAEKQATAAGETTVPLKDGDVVTAVIVQPEIPNTDTSA